MTWPEPPCAKTPEMRQGQIVDRRKSRENQSNDRCRIGCIVVNYNSARAVALLLDDLLKQDSGPFELAIVVADNSPSELELDSVRQTYRDSTQVRFERMPENLGYFGAAHWVYQAVWKHDPPEWVIISNPDIRLPAKDLLNRISSLPTTMGVVAPRIVSSKTHVDQNPFFIRRPSLFRLNLLRIVFRSPILFWLLGVQASLRKTMKGRLRALHFRSVAAPAKIYAPHGAFLLFSSEYFRRGGTLCYGAFLFAEELFVAETCRRLALEVTYLPGLQVLHDEHVATGKSTGVRRFKRAAADYLIREFFADSSQ